VNFDGVTCKIMSVPSTASFISVVQYMFCGISTFGKNLHFFWLFIRSLSSSVNDHIFILCPICAKFIARAQPQLPLPYYTNIFHYIYPSLCISSVQKRISILLGISNQKSGGVLLHIEHFLYLK